MKKKILILFAVVLVSVGAALTYFYFEAAVRNSINYIWNDLLDTNTHRALVIPLCLVITLGFFGIQHYLDPKSENHEAEGLGETPTPTVVNFAKVILIGFFSLVAGASLGPEAILVPACIIIGGYTGSRLFNKDKQMVGLLSMVGFVALIAAFFDSFIAGMLGLLLVTKQVKLKLRPSLILIAAIASAVTVGVLNILESPAYVKLPPHQGRVSAASILAVLLLVLGGYLYAHSLGLFHKILQKLRQPITNSSWWLKAIAAAGGLSILYLLGGNLVEFTGNQSVLPMLEKSASLGLVGLAWLLVVKIAAISWSKTFGYRGGLVFPSVFAASVLVAIAQLYVKDLSFIIGLIAVLVGLLAANAKLKVLF